jgi:glucose-6-phosphate 1-epimerase
VVWNPWTEKEKGFTDMAAGEYADMLCVETVNAGSGDITVPPGGKHALVAFIGVE